MTGEAIARKIDKVKSIIDQKKIHTDGFARIGTGMGEVFPVGKAVEQAAFTNIGTAHEGYLEFAIKKNIVGTGDTLDKLS